MIARQEGQVVGYAMSRPGARAWHLGPLAADTPETANSLVQATLAAATAPAGGDNPPELLMDAIMPNPAAVRLAQSLGLTLVRPFIRMTRGAPPPPIDAARLYTSAGPELG